MYFKFYFNNKNLIVCLFAYLLLLTPKFLVFFLPNFAVFDIVGKINFSKNKSMRI
jgi:hypothetical protein